MQQAGSSTKRKKTQTVRPSLPFCEERLICKGTQPKASYHCVECGSLQCELCEAILHENIKYIFHDRTQLKAPPADQLCEGSCLSRNYADVFCGLCIKRFCYNCDSLVHSTAEEKMHRRIQCQPVQVELMPAMDVLKHDTDQSMLRSTDEPMHSTHQELSKHFSNFSSLPDVADVSMESHVIMPIAKSRGKTKSFQLLSDDETLLSGSVEDFVKSLGCPEFSLVKVVSVFGNTGEGKSYTLNYTFFDSQEIFNVSPSQTSCTQGVWAAYDPKLGAVVIDTEGMLGLTNNQNQRTRLLLKILAISDVVLYRTRAERLHNDMFEFLGDASKAYEQHFSKELQSASKECKLEVPLSSLGPVVIIFHETTHTNILKKKGKILPDEELRRRFDQLGYTVGAFCAIEYVGTQTVSPPTDFSKLMQVVTKHLQNFSVRSPRPPAAIYQTLKLLNEKFNGEIPKTVSGIFLLEFFTCSSKCLSCGERCTGRTNHMKEGSPHLSAEKCRYQHQFDNRIYQCRACYDQGREMTVVPKATAAADSTWVGLAKYAWAGYVLECLNCGIIYRSRQYWFGNPDPINTVVRTETQHIWPGGSAILQGTENAAQRVLDSVTYLSSAVSTMSAGPTKVLSDWMTDQVAPSYWIPNNEIKCCMICNKNFGLSDKKHHCRACGGGCCSDCSTHKKPVSEKGWGMEPVRVCERCYNKDHPSETIDPADLTARKVSETMHGALGTLGTVLKYPIGVLKSSARPSYWVPDDTILKCFICDLVFSETLLKHHCRGCGQGVCDECSVHRLAVPSRGWDQPVRVCKHCSIRKDL